MNANEPNRFATNKRKSDHDIPKYSEKIKDIVAMLKKAESDYKWHCEQVTLLDKYTQDLLHSLELDNLSYKERSKVATKIRNVRQARREHKDTAEATRPIVDFLESDRGNLIYNLLRDVQGKSRKVEEYHANRVYIPRVSRQIEIEK